MENPLRTNTIILILFYLFSSPLASKACHPIDKEALLDFKKRITSDASQFLISWTASSNCCTAWRRIQCDIMGRVVNVSSPCLFSGEVFIEDTSMTGTLSPLLRNFHLLDSSNLKELTGPIPPESGRLTELAFLFLDTNKLNGTIPPTCSYVMRLKKLYLSDNLMTGVVPSFIIGSWTSISEPGLSGNLFSAPIPSRIRKLVMLTKFDLLGNNFSRSIPSEISNLKNLNYLDLSENQLTGRIPESIGSLSSIELLYLHQNQLTGSMPSSVSDLSSMQFR